MALGCDGSIVGHGLSVNTVKILTWGYYHVRLINTIVTLGAITIITRLDGLGLVKSVGETEM